MHYVAGTHTKIGRFERWGSGVEKKIKIFTLIKTKNVELSRHSFEMPRSYRFTRMQSYAKVSSAAGAPSRIHSYCDNRKKDQQRMVSRQGYFLQMPQICSMRRQCNSAARSCGYEHADAKGGWWPQRSVRDTAGILTRN
jgi:hypothetical protein